MTALDLVHSRPAVVSVKCACDVACRSDVQCIVLQMHPRGGTHQRGSCPQSNFTGMHAGAARCACRHSGGAVGTRRTACLPAAAKTARCLTSRRSSTAYRRQHVAVSREALHSAFVHTVARIGNCLLVMSPSQGATHCRLCCRTGDCNEQYRMCDLRLQIGIVTSDV